ncbi:MAG: toll/interleukin-1 receptor domain-containing protein [Rheinheimera sp.]
MAEYLARVSWDSVLRFKDYWQQSSNASGSVPLSDQYGSDQPALQKLRYADGLWLFIAPEFGKGANRRILPPSILGRIEITHQRLPSSDIVLADGAPACCCPAAPPSQIDISRGFKFWRGGVPGPALPIHNAFSLFKTLTFIGEKTQIDPNCAGCRASEVPQQGPYGHLMLHFQAIRQLSVDGANQLFMLQDKMVQKKTVFFSHCHRSAAPLVEAVANLLEPEALCWWDTKVMPQNRWYNANVLADMLHDGIRQAKIFVAFVTPDYFDSQWTRVEWDKAQQTPGLLVLAVMLGGTTPKSVKRVIQAHLGTDAPKISDFIRQYL